MFKICYRYAWSEYCIRGKSSFLGDFAFSIKVFRGSCRGSACISSYRGTTASNYKLQTRFHLLWFQIKACLRPFPCWVRMTSPKWIPSREKEDPLREGLFLGKVFGKVFPENYQAYILVTALTIADFIGCHFLFELQCASKVVLE